MHIIELRAENIKRLTAVKIKPDGKVVTISGKNGQGKSSVLDSIWYALGGAAAFDPEPIHNGAEEAKVFLDLGDLKVTRKIRRRENGEIATTLQVEKADGTRPGSPQTILNDLVGRFSLDPMEFARMAPKAQFDALKLLVPGLDLDAINDANKADYEKRTAENRRAKELTAAAAAISVSGKKAERVDKQPILDDLARAGEHNKAIAERMARRKQAEDDAKANEDTVRRLTSQIEDLEHQIEALRENVTEATKKATGLRQKLQEAPPLPEPLDTLKLTEALSAATAANEEADRQDRRAELERQAAAHEAAAKALTEAMEAREEHKRAAIAAAKFPVEGLSLGDEEVLVDGYPFSQAATSKKIRTSVALAMALQPEIRVCRIMDGSLLDSDAIKIIAEMAEANDYQVWMEAVESRDPSAIIIEDGYIKEN